MTSLRPSLSFFYSGCIIVLLFYIVPPVYSQGCVQEGTTGAITSYIPMSGAYGQENITNEVCSASCGYAPEAVGYGLTGEGICMCLPPLMTKSLSSGTGICDYACPKDPAQICGSYTESNISSEVVTANNSIYWNRLIPPLNAVSFDLKSTFTAPNIVTVALSNVSTGGAAANISFAINEDTIGGGLSSNALNIVLNQPGDVVVTVRAENSDGVRLSQSKVALVTMPPLTKTVLCDVVASDEEDYFCSYSVQYSSGPITAGFASTADYLTPGANYEYYGNTPQYADPLVAFQSSSVIRTLVFGKRVEEETVVKEIRGYSTASGSIKIKRFTPDCDGNPFEARFRGRCEIDLPYTEKRTTTILTDEIDCKPGYVFVAAEVTCRDPACSISCSELETPNYSKLVGVGGVVKTIPQGYFSIILTEDLRFTVYPGDYLGFEGDTIAVSDETDSTLADIELSADGSMVSTLQKSYLQIVTERMNFYDLPNRCASTKIATTLTFSTNDGTNTKTNLTNCQYPIEGLLPMISFSITTVPPDIDVNDVNAVYYARVDDVVTLDSTITKGWPVYYTVSWGDGTPDDVLHENGTNAKPQTFTHNFESEGNYTVNITAYNLHSEDYGIVGYKPNTTRTLYIQYPVKEWIIEIDPNWLDSDGAYVAQLVYPDNTPWPTAASYWCDWGDGLPPVTSELLESDSVLTAGVKKIQIEHTFQLAGEYNITCKLFNLVSEQWLNAAETNQVYQAIVDFEVDLRYIPMGLDEETHLGLPAFGPQSNQLPLDRKITLFFKYTKGTIEQIRVTNITNSSNIDLGTFQVPDKWNANEHRLHFNFSYEAFYNISVEVTNSEMNGAWVKVEKMFQIVGKVINVKIDDFKLVVGKEEPKMFEFKFESTGAGTCMIVDYKDGFKRAYGDEKYCAEWKPSITYDPAVEFISSPMILNHTYWSNGIYNVTAEAMNKQSDFPTTNSLLIIVSNSNCKAPTLRIPFNSSNSLAPIMYARPDNIVIETLAKLECAPVFTTKNLWRIYNVTLNITTKAETLVEVDAKSIAPSSYNESKILIPKLTLPFGLYKLTYTARMWDTSPLDESLTRTLPFESTVFTYIRVRPSPLVSIIMKGSPTTVSRGKGQLLTMEPYLYSMDPDFPELTYTGMEFRWYCREESESWPMNGSALSWNTRYPVPTQKLPPASITNNTQKGCFGYGPGPLDVKEGILSVPTGVFVQAGKNYEFMLILMKDVRNSTSKLLLTTVAGVPPVLEIACAEPSLCPLQASTGQVFINPTSRLGLRATCSNKQGSDCTGPLTYNWVVKDPTTLAPLTAMTNSLYFLGCSMVGDVQKCTSDLGMLVKMFQDFPRDEYIIELKGVNNLNTTGMIGLKLKVNKPPQGGSCLVIPPEDVSLSDITSLVDESEFVCSGWIDPEDIGIAKYTLFSTDANGKQATVVSLARFSPDVPTLLRLSPGKFNFKVVINDVWAASTEYIIPGLVEVKVPTPAQLLELETSGVMDQAMASQDSSLVMAILNAKMAILSDESNVVLEDTPANMNLSPQQKQELVSATIGQKKIEAMDSLVSNGATVATSPQSLSAVSQTLSNILGAPPEDGKPSTLGLEVVTKVVSISEGLVESLSLMDISTPELLKPMAISVVDNIGKVMSILMPDKVEPEDAPTKNESASALCEKISPVDKANANKPGTDYETEVGDDLTMTIPEDLKAQQCKGLAAATSTAGDTSGSKITDMIDDLSKLLLSKSIIGEEFNIDTKNIKILTKLVSGEDAKKEFEVPQTGVFIKLPDTFCLEVQINNTCEAPVGISAVVYYKNPRPDGLFSDRLAPDTLVLDCKLSDKNHQSAEVSEIYDPPFSGTPGIRFTIPRKISTHQTIRNMTLIKAKVESKSRRIRPLSHLVPVPKADSTITIEIDPIDVKEDHNLTLFISHEKIPTYNSFEFTTPVKDLNFTEIGVRYWFLNNSMVKNRTGSRWFLTVMDLTSALTVQEIADKKFSADKISDFRADYKLRTYTSGCYFLDEKFEIWSGRALEVVETTYNQTVCVSAHMTLFAAGFFVQPNSMDFDFILKEMDFFDNETIYSTILITCIAYLLFLIVARFVDYTDVQRVGCKPLPDNNVEETYAYEILVLTGAKSESTCKSKVYFVLNGDKNETDVRQFPNGADDYFERGGIDSFVMTVARPLGNLNFLRIWHDNSGIGDYASWFLGAIIIRDLQTKQKYQFFNDRWLAIEKDDGEIERIIPLAGNGSPLKSTFQQSKENNLKQNHLWLASFFRPPRSRFTRCQRVACLFTFLFLSMFGNALWYSIIDIRDSDQVSLGLVDLTLNEVFVGLAANLVSFPIVLLITILFKYSKSRILRKNRIVRALNLEDEAYTIVPNIGLSSADGKKKKKFLLPWFCSVLGWLLCLLSIVVSVYFLVTFGVVLGNQKVHRWLGCFFVTFFSSFLIVEPIKVVIYAVLYQVVCKMDLDDDLDDSEADEESVMINHDPKWDSDEKIIKTKTYIPYSEEHLENLRKSRIKELKSQAFAKEIITYIIFLFMIYIISVDNRDKNSIFLKNQIEKNFILKNKFHEIVTTDDYWKWVHSTLLSELKAGPLYNGDPPYGLRGFIGDHTQRILGFATLRQVRIKRNSCTVAPSVVDLTKECAQLSNLINEEKKDFCNAWEERTELTKGFPSCQSAEFRYKTDVEMQGWPISAWRDTYSGGGYVVNLKGTNAALSDRLQYLQEQHWINNQTRAVLLEFGTYNVNLNLFAVVTIAGEWLPGGGVSPYWRIDPIRLITVFTFFGTLAVISQIGCIGFILYFMLREITKMFKMKMEYWKSYWAYVEVGIVLDAFAAVGLFLYRNMLTQEIMKIFAETYGNGFIRLQWVGMIDEYYGYTIGLLMFMAVLKLLKILEFNNKMSLLNFTLLRCWESLSGFLVIFFFAFFSFVQMFYFILYSDMKDFSDIGKAFKTCSTMMLNKFDFGELLQTSQTAAIMFFVYAVAVNTLLINVLLTIIIEGYEEVKAELEGRKNELEVIQYMKDVIKFMVGADKRPNFLKEFSPEGLKNEQLVINKDDEALDQEEEENVVDELPEKVDEILQYINSTYFDGELDLKTKKMFEKGMRNQEGTTGLEIIGVDDL